MTEILERAPDQPDACALVAALDDELRRRDPGQPVHGLQRAGYREVAPCGEPLGDPAARCLERLLPSDD